MVQNFAKYDLNPRHFAKEFKNIAEVVKFRRIWSHRTLRVRIAGEKDSKVLNNLNNMITVFIKWKTYAKKKRTEVVSLVTYD